MDKTVIRRVRPGDHVALSAFYATLSAESRHARFLGCSAGLGGNAARTLCCADHEHEEGLVAMDSGPTGEPVVIGHVCIVGCDDGCGELAIAVADESQGRGIGRRLFKAAVDWAHDHRRSSLTAIAYADNSRVLHLLGSTPYATRTTSAEAGVVEVEIMLAA